MKQEDRIPERLRLAAAVEATRLSYGLTAAEVIELVRRAVRLGARGVCVPPAFVSVAAKESRALGTGEFDLVAVLNFPTGDHAPDIVDREAAEAVRAGAGHVDLVVPGGLVASRDWRGVTDSVSAVRRAIDAAAEGQRVALKAILETAAWDEDRVRAVAAAAVEGGADWLKTSTGFHPAGGATLEVVALLRGVAPASVGVKASGGIRTREAALAMLDAGADRIGTSSEAAILAPAG